MPIYEYKCLDCGSHIEKMQKASDEPLRVCEKCGGKLEKQWSLSGIQFKGEGWYVTDYSNKLKDGSDKTEKPEKVAKPEKSSSSESTAKPETASNKTTDSASSKKDAVSKKE
ncbi:MAG: FmdB family zinc ribbon protein [Acidobacteriota bacterium]